MKLSHVLIAILCALAVVVCGAQAQAPAEQSVGASAEVPRLIKFSGTLLDAQERPVAGPVGVTFALYARQTGGAALWLETQNVKPDANGNYTVLLGAASANGVPAELFTSAEARWLGIQVGQEAEQARILLVSVPYALKAKDAETLGGLPASAFVTTETVAGAGSSTGAAASTAAPGGATTSNSTAQLSSSTQSTTKNTSPGVQPVTVCTAVTSDGAAPISSLAKFTTACKIEGSAVSESSGLVGIGGAPATGTKLFLTDSETNPSITRRLQQGLFNTSATANGTYSALTFDMDMTNMSISPGVTDMGSRLAFRSLAYANTLGFAGTLNLQVGVQGQAGIRSATSGAKVVNAYGGQFQVLNRVAGTTITNAYGVFISNSDTTGTITNRYDLFASSPNANNFFAGKVGIGKTTPVAPLDVVGNINSTGTITGTQLVSTIATGTAPLSVTSTTVVPNLNASLLGGMPPGLFAQIGAPNLFTGNNVFTADQIISTSDSTAASSLTVSQTGTGNGPALTVTQNNTGSGGGPGIFVTQSTNVGPAVSINQGGAGDALDVNVAAGTALAVDGQGDTLVGGPLALIGAGLVVIPAKNDATTGTTLNSVAKLTCPTECFVIKTATTDIGGAVGIVVQGAGTTGHAEIAVFGILHCNFDNTATAGDYVQLSSTVAGDCHDAGATFPASGQVLGRVTPGKNATTPTCTGLCRMYQFPAEIRP